MQFLPNVRLAGGSLLALALAAGLPGCGESPSGDFKPYDELAGSEKVPAVEVGNGRTADETNSASETESGKMARANGEAVSTAELPNDSNIPPASFDTTDDEARETTSETDSTDPADPAGTSASPHGDVPAIAEKPLPEDLPPAAPRKVELLVKEHQFPTEGGHLRVSYDDIDLLRVLNMDPVTPDAPDLMPKWLRGLDGKRIRIRGFMYPPFQETGIEHFVLARDNQICCFGRNPKVYDLVDVRMETGKSTHYIQNRPFDVTGVFHIEPVADPDSLRLYWIDEAQVMER